LPTVVREPIRKVYQRANSGRAPQSMSPEVRRQVEALYRESNERAAAALRAHGYQHLPDWLDAPATTA
jgi:DNA-binding GntR family transcriptional regulator